ncbi:MAG: two pore domain potassium channel family protein [Alphaproteobacteria bacterium]|nr:two pore domain potassium channel family protein [Alphaproteobacteria bacterium]
MELTLAITLSMMVVLLTLFLQYETMFYAWKLSDQLTFMPTQARIMVLVLLNILAHFVHITIFAGAYMLAISQFKLGTLVGEVHDFLDFYYFSTVTYVSLGYGDIIPKGQIRIMASIQGVTGLILIGCSVSLIFLFMERYWRQDPQHSSQRQWQKSSVSLAEVRKNK